MTLGQFRALPEDERDEMLAAYALVCPQCGNLRSVCSDPARDWHVNESVCWPTASTQWGVRRLQAKHKAWKPETNPDEVGPLEGVSVWVSDVDLTPKEDSGLGLAQETDDEHHAAEQRDDVGGVTDPIVADIQQHDGDH